MSSQSVSSNKGGGVEQEPTPSSKGIHPVPQSE